MFHSFPCNKDCQTVLSISKRPLEWEQTDQFTLVCDVHLGKNFNRFLSEASLSLILLTCCHTRTPFPGNLHNSLFTRPLPALFVTVTNQTTATNHGKTLPTASCLLWQTQLLAVYCAC